MGPVFVVRDGVRSKRLVCRICGRALRCSHKDGERFACRLDVVDTDDLSTLRSGLNGSSNGAGDTFGCLGDAGQRADKALARRADQDAARQGRGTVTAPTSVPDCASSVLPKPMPGSMTIFSRGMPARRAGVDARFQKIEDVQHHVIVVRADPAWSWDHPARA